jgi:hypothetical protein
VWASRRSRRGKRRRGAKESSIKREKRWISKGEEEAGLVKEKKRKEES